MHHGDQPTIVFGVRGILYVEINATGANRDVHSGNLGALYPSRTVEGFFSGIKTTAAFLHEAARL